MAALEDRSKDQKNRKHQHQMWPGKENSIPSGKRNSRGWCFFFEKKKCIICSICLLVPWVAGKSQFLSGSNSFKKETIELDGSSKWPLRAVTTPRAKQNPVAHSSIARHFFKRYKDQEERDREEMAIKMNIAYIVVKEELPFSKCEGLVSPQKKNGLEINMTYANDQSRAKMVSVVVNMYKDQLTDEFRRTNYISVMADCKTDTGGLKNETMYAHFIREGRPVNRLVAQKAREE